MVLQFVVGHLEDCPADGAKNALQKRKSLRRIARGYGNAQLQSLRELIRLEPVDCSIANRGYRDRTEPQSSKLLESSGIVLDVPFLVVYAILRKKLFRSCAGSSAFPGVYANMMAHGSP